MFWERFYNLCIKNGKKPNPLGKEIGISSGIISKWKNGSIPNGETLIVLAKFFNCSVDYLLGLEESQPQITEYNNSSVSNNLDEQQQKLIDNYNKLNDSAQKALVQYSDFMITKPENLKEPADADQMIS
ncbi:MAG: helix-turn-helix domain-containing protein [Clostridia bacterium]|nr:helix-turn-helix domain-containing protein [Clostridia bacterium]